MFDSVRARLTVVITILTGVAAAASVFFGSALIERNLIEEALQARIDAQLSADDELLMLETLPSEFDVPVSDVVAFGDLPEAYVDGIPADVLVGFEAMGGVEQSFLDAFPVEVFPNGPPAALFEPLPEFDGFSDIDPAVWTVATVEEFFDELDRTSFTRSFLELFGHNEDEPVDVVDGVAIVRYNFVADEVTVVASIDPFLGPTVEPLEVPSDSTLLLPITELIDLTDAIFEQVPNGPDRLTDEPIDLRSRFGETADGVTFAVFADVSERLESVDEIRGSLWFAAGILTVLAALATWILTGRSLRPVDAITHRVSDISAGNLNERVPVPDTRDEINELATTMNSMLDRIEAGDTQRRRFVSDASHELRTPVAVLRSEAEVALKSPDTTTVAELADVVLDESTRMGSMVEDLLTLARSDEHLVVAPAGVVDLDDIVLADAARTRSVPLDLRQVSGGRVRGAVDELSRVVTHLIDNAARHAQTHAAVGVYTSPDARAVVFWVDDDGAGIAPDDRERVFERFVRLDEARNRDAGGAGLGLAVVAATVTKLGGSVVASDSPLGGARIVVSLPAA